MNERRSNEVFGGTFLIGLAILFLINWWWPGIMFVIGIALIARTVAEGRNWMSERGGLVCIGIGVFFTLLKILSFTFNLWPLILIAIGVYMLFGNRRGGLRNWNRSGGDSEEKPKRDDLV
ncbi:MAG: hypothetical protein ABI700_21105 [Chloroflexota bacterium]